MGSFTTTNSARRSGVTVDVLGKDIARISAHSPQTEGIPGGSKRLFNAGSLPCLLDSGLCGRRQLVVLGGGLLFDRFSQRVFEKLRELQTVCALNTLNFDIDLAVSIDLDLYLTF
jgi:hypothetical protein